MLLSLLVFDQKGSVNDIFAIMPAIAYDKKDNEKKNKEEILQIFRRDREVGVFGGCGPTENPSLNISTIEFYYTPLMEKQRKYKKLPYQLTSTIQVIDVFTCLGSRFGLEPLSVLVEICESNCGVHSIWANIYYAADGEVPASIITITKYSMFVEDCHIPEFKKKN